MKKLLVLAIFGLLFAVAQAADRGFPPDVGYEFVITQAQPVVLMPVMVVDQQFVAFAQLSATQVITQSGTAISGNVIYYVVQRKTKDVNLTAYHNPDYGRCSTYNLSLLITKTNLQSANRLVTTRHVI